MTDINVPVYNVGIFMFNEVEVLDFAGPFEVFSISVRNDQSKAFRVYTVSEDGQMISARNGMLVQPECSFATLPPIDLLIVPGGYGAEEIEIHKPQVMEWIRSHAEQQRVVASICTGALLLAEAGLLNGLSATTHWMDLERLERDYPQIQTRSGIKYVDEGQILTSGGISAGIHLSLHLVRRYMGMETAQRTAKRMEYDWNE